MKPEGARDTADFPGKAEVIGFFKGRPASLKLFMAVRKMIGEIGSPEVKVMRTQISFGEALKYAWVWLPQRWISKRDANSITLTLVTGKPVRSSLIEESVQPKKGYWTHHIIIESGEDLGRELRELVKKSYDFYLERLAGKKKRAAGSGKHGQT
jgi:hypothetical protein